VSNILTGQYSRVHNEDLCSIPCFVYLVTSWLKYTSFLDPIYMWLCILECLFWEDRLRSSFGFQLAIKPTFVSMIRVRTIESMPITCVDHLFHALGISSYCIRSTNGTSLVAFSNTSCYMSISWKIMNSPHEYSSKFKG